MAKYLLVLSLLLGSCVATEATLEQHRLEVHRDHTTLIQSLNSVTGKSAKILPTREVSTSSEMIGAIEALLGVGGLGATVLVSRLLSRSKPRLDEHALEIKDLGSRVGSLEK